ncbi:hypothetical protein V6N12_036758 [Hibiscus sabdariffa]|uniref:Uncharacterized protein n=1 Tax=Hibiscus sabdariffa TaxID=183260 RepID=A0ABR1ZMX6_9ROSI
MRVRNKTNKGNQQLFFVMQGTNAPSLLWCGAWKKRSSHVAKRRHKRTTTLIDEFLDENSQLQHAFFPNMKIAIDPMKTTGNESHYYHLGKIWLDTEGNPIQAHGGGMPYDERSATYYWYGEYKDGPT